MPVRAQVGIVADDLTGAIETGCVFANQGMASRVMLASLPCPQSARAPVVAINTRTRGRHGPEVWDQLALAAAHPAIRRASLVYKKIDSTLRGDPAYEIACLTALLQRQLVIITPTLPSQGRALVEGRLYVNGIPIEHTQYATDLVAPAHNDLQSQLERALPEANVVGGNKPPAVSTGRTTVWVADTESAEDLSEVARWGLCRPEAILFAGSAGLATALAQQHRRQAPAATAPRFLPPQLFVLGSRSEETKRQIRALQACGDVTLVTCGVDDPPASPARQTPMQTATTVLVPADLPQNPQQVAQRLAAAAWAFVRAHRVRRVFASGGDTAMAFLDLPGVRNVAVKAEVAPGMCLSRFRHNHEDFDLITKPGGYGDDNALASLLAPGRWSPRSASAACRV